MTDSITPTQHSSLVGGSTAARRIGCQRSYALEQYVIENSGGEIDKGSVYAQEGTVLHEIMAIALEKDIEPTTLLPFTFKTDKDGGWEFTVDLDLWEDKGEPALKAFDTFVAEQEERLGEPMQFLIETSVQFPGIEGAFGTSDIIARCGNEIFVLDWKFGRGVVPAEENKQLMFYTAGALNTARDFFKGMALNHETPVTMAIIQLMRPGVIDTWRTDLLRLHHFEVELHGAIQAIQNEGMDAPIKEGSWCTFAKCKTVCPLHIGAARKLADSFDKLKAVATGERMASDEEGDLVGICPACGSYHKDYEEPKCDCLEPPKMAERYAEMLDLVDMVEDWCKEVREQAHSAANSGADIPGWVLEKGRKGPRKWAIDEKEVIDTFTGQGFDLDEDTVAPRKVLTLPQLEKILKRQDKVIPDDFVTQSEPTTTRLVRAENATEVVEPTAKRAAALAEKLMKL